MKMREFYETVASDPALQKQVMEILAGAAEKGAEATEAALLAFAREQGLEASMEEVRAYFTDTAADSELSPAELDLVAGGNAESALHLQIIRKSIVRLGVGCALVSLRGVIYGNCMEELENWELDSMGSV